MFYYHLVLLILTRTSYACNAVGISAKQTQATLKYANTINYAIVYHRNRIHFLYKCKVPPCTGTEGSVKAVRLIGGVEV